MMPGLSLSHWPGAKMARLIDWGATSGLTLGKEYKRYRTLWELAESSTPQTRSFARFTGGTDVVPERIKVPGSALDISYEMLDC